ncbi:hypothetical protein ACWEQ1_19095 [Streptomyces nodosus]
MFGSDGVAYAVTPQLVGDRTGLRALACATAGPPPPSPRLRPAR